MSRLGHTIHLALESRFENIELVQLMLEESLRGLDCDEDSRYWMGIAVREAVANAIQHGNRQDPGKQVEVKLELDDQILQVRVKDAGEGFDPKDVPDPLAPENLLKPDGRGIFYMGRFMDEVSFDFPPEGGTSVTLRIDEYESLEASSGKEEEAR